MQSDGELHFGRWNRQRLMALDCVHLILAVRDAVWMQEQMQVLPHDHCARSRRR